MRFVNKQKKDLSIQNYPSKCFKCFRHGCLFLLFTLFTFNTVVAQAVKGNKTYCLEKTIPTLPVFIADEIFVDGHNTATICLGSLTTITTTGRTFTQKKLVDNKVCFFQKKPPNSTIKYILNIKEFS